MAYTKRADGRYVSKVTLNDGTKKYLYAYSVTELKQKEMELRQKVDKGFDILRQSDSLQKWAERTFDSKKRHLNPKEYRTYEARVNYFLYDLGEYPIVDIRRSHIEPLIDTLAIENPRVHTPTSKKTMMYYLSALSDVFEFAIADHVIEYNPCKYIKIDRDAPQSNRRALTDEEQFRVLHTPHEFQTPVLIAMLSGLRRGEITALQWSDIDFNLKQITVNKAYDFANNTVKSPKTVAGYRTVPMPDLLVAHLTQVQKTSMFVCPNKDGKMLSNANWKQYFGQYFAYLDDLYSTKTVNRFTGREQITHIQKFGMHDLRHTFCTNLYHSGCPANICKNMMGHKDIITTLNIYTHLDKEEAKHSAAELNDFLNKKMAGK